MIGLKIGGVPEHFNLPWRLAINEGKFQQIGLELHWSDMSGGTGQMIRGLESGSIDIAVLLTEGITKSILEGLQAKIIQVYVVSPLHWGIHVPYHSNIYNINDLENKTFAISREGSGSHLMTYIIADQQGWKAENLKFNVVGDIYGGLWALENNQAQGFLWEKYTTQPFTEQKKCRYVGEVLTPWPCFVIAARNEIIERHKGLLDQMCAIINAKTKAVKSDPNTVEVISWRYNIPSGLVEKWLEETEWNYSGKEYTEVFENTIQYLTKMGLIKEEQEKDWQNKLF